MTCSEFETLVATVNPLNVTTAEAGAVVYHMASCVTCRDKVHQRALAVRAMFTPEVARELDKQIDGVAEEMVDKMTSDAEAWS